MTLFTKICLGSALLFCSFVAGNFAYVVGGNVWRERQAATSVGMIPSHGIMGVTLHGWQLYAAIAGLAILSLCLAGFSIWAFTWRSRHAA